MVEQSYQKLAEMVRLNEEFEKFTMSDLEKIIGWIGDPNIPSNLKGWMFTSGGNLKEYPVAHLSIRASFPKGVSVIFEKWDDGNNPKQLSHGVLTSPDSLRRVMPKILKQAKRIMDKRTERLRKEKEHWEAVMRNFQ